MITVLQRKKQPRPSPLQDQFHPTVTRAPFSRRVIRQWPCVGIADGGEALARLLAVTFMRWDWALSAEPAISKMLNIDMVLSLGYSDCMAVLSDCKRRVRSVRLAW